MLLDIGDRQPGKQSERQAVPVALAGVLGVLLPLGVSPANAASPMPPTSCEQSRLPVPGNAEASIVTAGDPSGRYLAGRSYVDGTFRRQVLVWEDGVLHRVDAPGLDQQIVAINSKGTAVGNSYSEKGVVTPWVYRNGKVGRLPGEGDVRATDINERGEIAGTRGTEGWWFLPVRWQTKSREMDELSLPDEHSGQASGITADGTVIVTIRRGRDRRTDQILGWRPDGSTFELPLPAGAGAVNFVSVQGTKVAAMVTTADGGQPRSVLWDLDDLGQPKVISTKIAAPEAVNKHGWIVGTSAGFGFSGIASIKGGVVGLGGWLSSISADGTVVGSYEPDDNGALWGVRWTCR